MVEHIHRVAAVAGGQRMEVRLALQAELLPGLAAVAALDQAEGVDCVGPGCRVSAAVDRVARGGVAHVIVLRPRRLGPMPVGIHGQAVVTGDQQLLAVGAERQPVDVHQRHRRTCVS